MNICQNEACSQHLPLHPTGFNEKQGCTYYCKICGWGYWTHYILPTTEEVQAAEKAHPKYTKDRITKALTLEVLKPKPPGTYQTAIERQMIDHLGGFQPYWLNPKLKRIWHKKCLKLHPPIKKEK